METQQAVALRDSVIPQAAPKSRQAIKEYLTRSANAFINDNQIHLPRKDRRRVAKALAKRLMEKAREENNAPSV